MISQGLTVYSLFFLATALISFLIAFLSWQRKSVNAARELTFLMLAAGIGAFCLIFETAASTESEKIFWSKLEYIGGITTPVFYLIFVLRFTGKDKFLSARYILLLFLIPVITFLLTITNELHKLIWTGFSEISPKTNLMEYYHGVWFWIGYIAYTYILLVSAAILLLNFILHQKETFRAQGWVIFIAGLFPWIASVLYLMRDNPVHGLDLPPVSIALSGALAAFAILNYRFLDLVPVARETLVETLSDGIIALDAQNRIQDINEAALVYLGIKDRSIIGHEALKSGASEGQLLDAAINKENISQIEIGYKSGVKTFSITKNEIKRRPGSRLIVIHDITERILAQEEIAEKEEKYRGLSEASFEAIFISENGVCLEQNLSAEKMFGYTSAEAIGRHGTQWVVPEDRNMVANRMEIGYEDPYEATALRKDGSTFPCLLHGKMMHFRGRRVRVTSLSNITERKRFEEELIKSKNKAEESDRLKSAFLANMSHEIRTPMNSILGFTNLLNTHDLSGELQKEYIQIINKGGIRLLNIINDIIDISKIESEQMEVYKSKTNINEQIDYISKLFKLEIEEKEIRFILKKSLTDEAATIETDREKLFAIFTNLVKNAIKFTYKGSIELGYELKNNKLEFFVKDTGVGIHSDHHELIFQRFRQANESLNRNYEGTGLGLSISKAYAELLGGRIWVNSKPGEGSVFYFTIPYIPVIKPAVEIETSVPEKSEASHAKILKVLIVENDKSSRMLLSKAISRYRSTELTAVDGKEAIELCRSNPDTDLILMDIKMPEMDGYEATREIRKFNKDIIIIAQTAFAMTGDKDRALEAGCNDYISKPIAGKTLDALIEKYFNIGKKIQV